MPQIVKYESTEVAVEKTLAGLAKLIRGYGGRRFEQIWDPAGRAVAGRAVAVRFAVDHPSLGELPVHMPARTVKIRRILLDGGKWRSYPEGEREEKVAEQAERIAWRHISDLTEQLLLAVRLDLKTLHEAFMADVEVYDRRTGNLVRMAEFLERRARTGWSWRPRRRTVAPLAPYRCQPVGRGGSALTASGDDRFLEALQRFAVGLTRNYHRAGNASTGVRCTRREVRREALATLPPPLLVARACA